MQQRKEYQKEQSNTLEKITKRLSAIYEMLTFRQIIDIIIFPVIWLISLFSKFIVLKKIWIIEENPNEACDNGYTFFKYLCENEKKNAYYVIKRKSKDLKKVQSIGNVIYHGSLKHWIYYMNASRIVVTQKYANPCPALFHILNKLNLFKVPVIFLQHGITKDDAKMFYYTNTKFRLFICGAKKEYEYVKEKFHYPDNYVVYTGFSRFDNLNLNDSLKEKSNKTILLYTTWRTWIKTQKDFHIFMHNYYELINNKQLVDLLQKNNTKLQIVLHKNMRKFKIDTTNLSKEITVNHNEDVDIQTLLNKADLLITDYSSISFDIAYRKRPIVYYQFDKELYRKKHLKEGYFSYQIDGFGDIVDSAKNVVDKIKFYIENDFKVEEVYSKRMKEFLERKDKNNCKRILEEIEKI